MEQTITSPAAQVIISIVPIVGIFFGALIIFFYILWKHHETTLQIKTGTFTPSKFNAAAFSLLTGLILTSLGLILSISFAIIDGFSYSILGGLIPATIGISMLIFYKIYPEFHNKK
ncbi:MAG: hypothetical protein K6F15_03435 [Treponema sp.]|nr:hypothetical protein [Treponema sp.]